MRPRKNSKATSTKSAVAVRQTTAFSTKLASGSSVQNASRPSASRLLRASHWPSISRLVSRRAGENQPSGSRSSA
jgi:hypothetical protein